MEKLAQREVPRPTAPRSSAGLRRRARRAPTKESESSTGDEKFRPNYA